MTAIEFELLLSYLPRSGVAAFKYPPLRDMIYSYFKSLGFDETKATKMSKDVIDDLYAKFVK